MGKAKPTLTDLLEIESLAPVLNDPMQFIQMLKIRNPQGKLVQLLLTEEQKHILGSLVAGDNTLVFKPRQIGSSTVCAAYLFYCWYTAQVPANYVILSFKLKSSQNLLKMHKTFYETLPPVLRRTLSTVNSTRMVFKDTGAGLLAESAKAEGGMRSDTCAKLHISEYAFIDNGNKESAKALMATAVSALNDGQLIIESTAYYHGDALHDELIKDTQGKGNWGTVHKFFWFDHEKYRREVPEDFSLTDLEKEVAGRYMLDMKQMAWFRYKSQSMDFDLFRREYPSCLEDAFQQTGNCYFTESHLKALTPVQVPVQELVVLHPPQKEDAYAVGVDVALGVGRDYSVIQVLSKSTYQPVAVFRSNQISPKNLAHKIQELATMYNKAVVLVEENNHGHVVYNELEHLGYYNVWKNEQGKNWSTNVRTKTLMYEVLKSLLETRTLRDVDSITCEELRTIVVDEKGIISVLKGLPHHGDSVVALGLACIALKDVSLPTREYLPAWVRSQKAKKTRLSTVPSRLY